MAAKPPRWGLIAKRADELVVGDRIEDSCLPVYSGEGDGDVIFARTYHYNRADWTFVAYVTPDGNHNSTSYLPNESMLVYPAAPPGHDYSRADPEVTQPIAGRLPAHLDDARTGEVVMVGGGYVEDDPPRLIVGDTADEQRANAYTMYERDEAEGYGEYLVSHGPVKPPYGSPEREAYDREHEAD